MSKPTLYIRDDKPPRKRDYDALHFGFHAAGSFSSYREAVEAGQASVGYGEFYVDTGDRAPSRNEQLLLATVSERALRRRAKIKDAQLAD